MIIMKDYLLKLLALPTDDRNEENQHGHSLLNSLRIIEVQETVSKTRRFKPAFLMVGGLVKYSNELEMSTRQTRAPILGILRPSVSVEKKTSPEVNPKALPHLLLTAMQRGQDLWGESCSG